MSNIRTIPQDHYVLHRSRRHNRRHPRSLNLLCTLLVTVHGFPFRFSTVHELELMIQRFKTLGPSKGHGEDPYGPTGAGHGHWERQSAFQRLPAWLKDKRHRSQVIRMLEEARKGATVIGGDGPNAGRFSLIPLDLPNR